jgi:hypothetical protein
MSKYSDQLMTNLMLIAKHHYGIQHNTTVGYLALFQHWIGTPRSSLEDAFSIYLKYFMQLPMVRNMEPTRLGYMIEAMVTGIGRSPYHSIRKSDSNYEFGVDRGLYVIAGDLCLATREDMGIEGEWPTPDPAIQRHLDQALVTHKTMVNEAALYSKRMGIG